MQLKPPILPILVITLIWGCNFVVGRIGVGEIAPLFYTGMRFLVVALLMTPLVQWRTVSKKSVLILGLVMGVCHFGVLFLTLATSINLPSVILIAQLSAPISYLLGVVFLKEAFSLKALSYIFLAFFGVFLLFIDRALSFPLIGVFLAFFATASFSIGNLLMKRLPKLTPEASVGGIALVASPILLCISHFYEGSVIDAVSSISITGIACIAYTALLSSTLAYILWYRLLATYELTKLSGYLLLVPLFGVTASVITLDEPASIYLFGGGALIILSIIGLKNTTLQPKPNDHSKKT